MIRSIDDPVDVLAASHLFDHEPTAEWTDRFLSREGHHLLIAYVGKAGVGFVSGIEMIHPDKGNEMMLYELAVDAPFRRRGIGRDLVRALLELARTRGCRSMWVPTDAHNRAAIATYRSAGATEQEPSVILSWDPV